jgi:hypothetical protein
MECSGFRRTLLDEAQAALAVAPARGEARGYRVYYRDARDPLQLRFRDVVACDRSYAILGSHRRAHIRIAEERDDVEPRHAVFRACDSADGQLSLTVSDLMGSRPLKVIGQPGRLRSFRAQGPLHLRLAGYELCALPTEGLREVGPEGGPGEGDSPDVVAEEDQDDAEPEEAGRARPSMAPPSDAVAAPREAGSTVAERGALMRLADRPDTWQTSAPDPWPRTLRPIAQESSTAPLEPTKFVQVLETSAEPPWIRVTLRGQRTTTFELTEKQLDGLVVFGRHTVKGGEAALAPCVSRMHVGLARLGRAVEVIDTASTYGTTMNGRPIQRVVLTEDAELLLADRVTMSIQWLGPQPASAPYGD